MKKVLLVEDEDVVSTVLIKVLEANGLLGICVGDGNEAWEVIHQEMPDLILLDILLPGIDGWALLSKIKNHVNCLCPKIPVLVLSNVTTRADDRQKALELGAIDYLVKANFSPGQIVARLKTELGV